jgi:hypothetical protein
MHASLRIVLLVVMGSTAWACSSSDSSTPAKSDSGAGGKAAGSGGKTGSSGAKSTGGGTSSSSSGGSTGTKCATDAGADNCRMCLASQCCDRFTDCLATSLCRSALATHEACFQTVGAEPSACFGDFSRTLQGEAGDSAGLDPLAACIITNCRDVCGGPKVL